jgi:hypothetical protein
MSISIESSFYRLPLWSVYVLTVALVLISVVGGYLLGRYVNQRRKSKKEEPIGAIVGALLGLLAFLLAFTFGMTASRFESRKQLLLDEVNAIGTAFLRADFLSDHQRTETKCLLKQYVDIRLEVGKDPAKLFQAMKDSEALHAQLWTQVVSLSKKAGDKILLGLFIQSLNEVIDFHTKRVTVGIIYRIPASIWLALYFVAILAMVAVGYHFGLTGGGSFLVSLLLSFAFSTVILLIADLDRTQEGFLKINQQPMAELQQKLSISVK